MTRESKAQAPASDPGFLWTNDEPLLPRRNVERLRPAADGHVPGEIGLWVFILGDMTVFGAFFLVFMWNGRQDPSLYTTCTLSLVQAMGLANTLVLLLSSWLVVLAVHAHRANRFDLVIRELAGTLVCAVAFATIKAFEYTHEVAAGNRPSSNIFFTFYFVLTGLHLVHVIVGSGLVAGWLAKARAGRPWAPSRRYVEAAAVYWHMVDLLWVVIFTIVYLVHLP